MFAPRFLLSGILVFLVVMERRVLSSLASEYRYLLADDLGYGELLVKETEIPTPHIDSIAANGVRFTAGYVAGPNCSPSRAGLLTAEFRLDLAMSLILLGPATQPLRVTTRVKSRDRGIVTGCVGHTTGILGNGIKGGSNLPSFSAWFRRILPFP